MVQRTGVEGISQMGRSTQGVKVMNIKDDDRVSAVALVVESEDNSAPVAGDPNQVELDGDAPIEIESSTEEVPPVEDDASDE
jgi:DNA gyrase subunit A